MSRIVSLLLNPVYKPTHVMMAMLKLYGNNRRCFCGDNNSDRGPLFARHFLKEYQILTLVQRTPSLCFNKILCSYLRLCDYLHRHL